MKFSVQRPDFFALTLLISACLVFTSCENQTSIIEQKDAENRALRQQLAQTTKDLDTAKSELTAAEAKIAELEEKLAAAAAPPPEPQAEPALQAAGEDGQQPAEEETAAQPPPPSPYSATILTTLGETYTLNEFSLADGSTKLPMEYEGNEFALELKFIQQLRRIGRPTDRMPASLLLEDGRELRVRVDLVQLVGTDPTHGRKVDLAIQTVSEMAVASPQ
jgi:hypothetical protein